MPRGEGPGYERNTEFAYLQDFIGAKRKLLENFRVANELSRSHDPNVKRGIKRDVFFNLHKENQTLFRKMEKTAGNNPASQGILETTRRQMEEFEKMFNRLYKPR